MEYKTLLDKIEIFREKSENGKLVIFVGAGVSCNVKNMPSWNSLVQKMANSINYSKCSTCKVKYDNCINKCNFKNQYSTDEFLKIPQYVYNTDKTLYNEILKDNIMHPQIDAPISSAIFNINPKHIITTNYDSLLETSSHEFSSQYQVIVKDKDLLNSYKTKYIVKMHGDINDIDTIVLKEYDYLSFSQNHVLIELFVKSLLVDHTVLFLGYSLNDYNVKLIINWINYMKIQNESLDEKQKVGYIILDEDFIDDREIKYFANNQIEVLNINKVKMIKDIPLELTDERGKRLYSFLKLIPDPSLDNSIDNITKSVSFLSQYKFVDYRNILKALFIKNYDLYFGKLRLYNDSDYEILKTFLSSINEEANHLKILFKNSGIFSITTQNFKNDKRIDISKPTDNDLQNNNLYKLYLKNKYGLLEESLKSYPDESNQKKFYSSFLGQLYKLKKYDKDVFSKLNNAEKLATLFNEAYIDGLIQFQFKSTKVENFIKNIPSLKERDLFKFYKNIFEGNDSEKLSMQSNLDKINSSTGKISFDFSKIQNNAYTQYYLYFYNNLNFKGYSNIGQLMEIYIEAVLSMNRKEEQQKDMLGFVMLTDRYSIEKLDIDIITKFISTKKLLKLIDYYHIDKIDIEKANIDFLINCFVNLIDTIIDYKIYGFRYDFFQIINNLSIILIRIDFDENGLTLVRDSILKFFSSEEVIEYFFSTDNFERNESLKIFERLIGLVEISSDNINALKKLVASDKFWGYSININFQTLQKFIGHLLPTELSKDQQIELKQIIDSTKDFNKKLIIFKLIHRYITDHDIKLEYKLWLSSNFKMLDVNSIVEFVFSDCLDISSIKANDFMEDVIELSRNQKSGTYTFPNLVDIKLECIYILYLQDIIIDIKKLEVLKENRPHLQFLLDPENFDYTQVNFSNYMWVNFLKQDKYMKHFIKNKQFIIPQIKERIDYDMATEDEKKILYGFLLNEEEIWRY